MKKLTDFILLLCALCCGVAFAQYPASDNEIYSTSIIYFSTPFSAKKYKKCIFGTKENAELSDDQQIGCEDRYNPLNENINRPIDLKLAKKIIEIWGNDYFFNNSSAYIYKLDEINKNRSIYLWPAGPNWMTPVDDDRYSLLPFLIYLSTVDHQGFRTRNG